jgi:chromosome segregation ATPase
MSLNINNNPTYPSINSHVRPNYSHSWPPGSNSTDKKVRDLEKVLAHFSLKEFKYEMLYIEANETNKALSQDNLNLVTDYNKLVDAYEQLERLYDTVLAALQEKENVNHILKTQLSFKQNQINALESEKEKLIEDNRKLQTSLHNIAESPSDTNPDIEV